jgi:hypothetical protein
MARPTACFYEPIKGFLRLDILVARDHKLVLSFISRKKTGDPSTAPFESLRVHDRPGRIQNTGKPKGMKL